MNILLIAPYAPPTNSAEAIQVARYLQVLDKRHHVDLVTTSPELGWIRPESNLMPHLERTNVIVVGLPLHLYVSRLLASRLLRPIAFPDHMFWLKYFSRKLTRVAANSDVIYSR